MKIKTLEILNKIHGKNFNTYVGGEFMPFNTCMYDQNRKMYVSMSLKFTEEFIENFQNFFIKKQYIRTFNRHGTKSKRLETYLFARCRNKTYRLGLWINQNIIHQFKFKRNKFKSYDLYLKIPNKFVGVRWEDVKNRSNRSIFLLPEIVNVDSKFSRQLGVFASDGFKSSNLGIRNTDEFLVKELRELFLKLNVTREKLNIRTKEDIARGWNMQYWFGFDNKILREFLNGLHLEFLNRLIRSNTGLGLIRGYIQGFHAGDGNCSQRTISIVSYKGDPGLEFIKKISNSVGLNLTYIHTSTNYENLYFTALPTYLNFYKNFIWHPRKLEIASYHLRNRDPFILLDKRFFNNIKNHGKRELSKIFGTDIRTVYRYFDEETFIPFSRLINFCRNKKINPKNLTGLVKKIRTSRETYKQDIVRDIYRDFLKINEVKI